MISSNLNFIATILAVLAIVKSGESLQCWVCSSSEGGACADYFNTTQYSRLNRGFNQNYQNFQSSQTYPTWSSCSNSNSYSPNSKAACMKKIIKDINGHKSYIRQCQILNQGEKIGTCPQSNNVDFCEYCDWDGCNGAHAFKSNAFWITVFSLFIALVLRK